MEDKTKEGVSKTDSRMRTWLADHFFKSFATFYKAVTFKDTVTGAGASFTSLTVNGTTITGAAVIPTQAVDYDTATAQTGTTQNAYGTPVELVASSVFESMGFIIGVTAGNSAGGKVSINTGAGNGTKAFAVTIASFSAAPRIYYVPFKIVVGTRITVRSLNSSNATDVAVVVNVTMLG